MNNYQKKKRAIANLFEYIKNYRDGISQKLDEIYVSIGCQSLSSDKIICKIPFTEYYLAKDKAYILCRKIELDQKIIFIKV